MRLLLIAALCLPVSAAHAQAWGHWQGWHAMHRCHPAGKPPAKQPEDPAKGKS